MKFFSYKIVIVALLLLPFVLSGGFVSVAEALDYCPTPSEISVPISYSSSTEAYKAGFSSGCSSGINNIDANTTNICTGRKVPSPYSSSSTESGVWVFACWDGNSVGLEIFGQDDPNGTDPEKANTIAGKCMAYANSASSATGWNNYYAGCMGGFTAQQSGKPSSYCQSLGTKKIGCIAGHLEGEKAQLAIPLPPPSAADLRAVARINRCGIAVNSNPNIEKGIVEGCLAGYQQAKTGGENTCPVLIGFSFSKSDPRRIPYNSAFLEACSVGYSYFSSAPSSSPSGVGSFSDGIVPGCDATKLPSEGGACGITAAQQLIKNIIAFLFWIVIPIAAIMIGIGGFTIMTAMGSPEKVKKGTGMITIALTGIAIMAVAYLIVQFIFSSLNLSGITFQ